MQDVTGLSIDFAQGLPGDGTVAGFDTGAEGLPEASDAVAQWLVVTRRAVDGLQFLEAAKPSAFQANFLTTKDAKKALDNWKADGATGKMSGKAQVGMGILIEPRAPGEREEFSMTVPAPADRQGVLRVTMQVAGYKPILGLPNSRLWVKIGGQYHDYREITGTLEKPQTLTYVVELGNLVVQSKGVTVSLSNRVEVPYAVPGFENEDKSNPKDMVPGGGGLFRPAFDRKATPIEKQPVPFVVLQSIQIEPNYAQAWPPTEWNANLGTIQDDAASAKKLLNLWMERSARRPVADAVVEPYWKLYEKLRAEGLAFDPALRAAFQSVLMSALFRYHASPAHENPSIANHALSSRLSFMFIGAPPDAELRALAASGKIRDTAVMNAQVDRLIADPRSDAFVRPFTMQWLELEQPITIAQSHLPKQDFRWGRYLKASMREETIQYIARNIAENRPAHELIASNWTLMNDTLARHYGYPALEGGELRKVKLRDNDPRGGGILGHAGIQSMLCWMGENWVIYRGAWALRHILNMPPPPPPLEVPELNPSEGKNKGKPFRELLKQHQSDNRCSICHKNIDPVGFAFQNFDISGRWRDVEFEHYARSELDGRIAWLGVGKTRSIDTTGILPRGEAFKTFPEFKQILAKHYRDDLVRGMLKNFFVYGTGHKPGIDDMAEIEAIMKTHRDKEYPLRDLLKALTRTNAFLGEQSKAK